MLRCEVCSNLLLPMLQIVQLVGCSWRLHVHTVSWRAVLPGCEPGWLANRIQMVQVDGCTWSLHAHVLRQGAEFLRALSKICTGLPCVTMPRLRSSIALAICVQHDVHIVVVALRFADRSKSSGILDSWQACSLSFCNHPTCTLAISCRCGRLCSSSTSSA